VPPEDKIVVVQVFVKAGDVDRLRAVIGASEFSEAKVTIRK